jgi:hypothetical protein
MVYKETNFIVYNEYPISMTYFIQADLYKPNGEFKCKSLVAGCLFYDSAVRYCERRNKEQKKGKDKRRR